MPYSVSVISPVVEIKCLAANATQSRSTGCRSWHTYATYRTQGRSTGRQSWRLHGKYRTESERIRTASTVQRRITGCQSWCWYGKYRTEPWSDLSTVSTIQRHGTRVRRWPLYGKRRTHPSELPPALISQRHQRLPLPLHERGRVPKKQQKTNK